MRVLRAGDYRRMRWKNGAGETVEIAVDPPSAGLDDFAWRISMARVGADGPFSLFNDVDRTLSILEGEGLELAVDGAPATLLTQETAPHAFPADKPVAARRIGGDIVDLNVMTRRNHWRHTASRMAVDGPVIVPAGGDVSIVFVASGRLSAGEAGENPDNAAVLEAHDAIILDAETLLRDVPPSGAHIYLVQLFRQSVEKPQ